MTLPVLQEPWLARLAALLTHSATQLVLNTNFIQRTDSHSRNKQR